MKKLLLSIFCFVALLATVFSATAVERTVCAVGCNHTTVGLAFSNVSDGDSVTVYDGTYTETGLVLGNNITFRSYNGSSSTILNLSVAAQVCLKLQAGAAGSTIGGSAGHGFTIQCTGAGRNIELENSPNYVTISYNVIDTSGSPTMGISVGAAGSTGLTVTYDTFQGGETGDGYIFAEDSEDFVATWNTMSFAAKQATGYAIEVVKAGGDSDINYNTITNAANGIFVLDGTGDTDDLRIAYNILTDCVNGVRFYSGYAVGGTIAPGSSDVIIEYNTISGATTGIKIPSGTDIDASNIVIRRNNLADNTLALDNDDAQTVTAENNYWGDDSPADDVSGLVDYAPFCASSSCSSYQGTYEKADLKDIMADGLGTAGAEFVSNIDLAIIAVVISFVVGIFLSGFKFTGGLLKK